MKFVEYYGVNFEDFCAFFGYSKEEGIEELAQLNDMSEEEVEEYLADGDYVELIENYLSDSFGSDPDYIKKGDEIVAVSVDNGIDMVVYRAVGIEDYEAEYILEDFYDNYDSMFEAVEFDEVEDDEIYVWYRGGSGYVYGINRFLGKL